MKLQKIVLRNVVASSQPRPLVTAEVDKLAASIKEVGLIQPVTVRETVVVHGTAEKGWQIVAGHHRVAACRALGWAEIDALVIEDAGHLQTELIEIDENLCRAELTASQRTGFTKRRKQIWEALHPEEKSIGATCATTANVSARGRVGEGRPEGFASATAEATGQSKATTNRAIARADALGDEALTKVANTSLDSGVELDALAKMNAPERTALIDRAAAGEKVSARVAPDAVEPVEVVKAVQPKHIPILLFKAIGVLVRSTGFESVDELVKAIKGLTGLTRAEKDTLVESLDDLKRLGDLANDII